MICNWCARTDGSEPAETGGDVWSRATLTIEGIDPGALSWLPEKTLWFCGAEECRLQLQRCEDFVLGGEPDHDAGSPVPRARLAVEELEGVAFDEARRFSGEGGAEDVRALGRFFCETSHPKLRRILEAHEASRERRAESPEAESREQRAESREQRAQSREHRAESTEQTEPEAGG